VIANRLLELVDCVFRNNTGPESSSVVVDFGSVLHFVSIRNCSFTNEYAETFGVVTIRSSGFKSAAREDFWKWAASNDGRQHRVVYPAALIYLSDLIFVNCTVGSYGVLALSHLPHVYLSNIRFQGYGVFSNVNRFTNTINAFTTEPNAKLPRQVPSVPLSVCLSIANLTKVEELEVAGLRYEHFECLYGMYFSDCNEGIIVDLVSRENVVAEASGAVLFFNFSHSLVVSEIVYLANRNHYIKAPGTFCITGSNLTASIRNGEFAENQASNGGVFHCSALSIANASFTSNIAQSGGVVYMEPVRNLNSAVHISNSKFTGNAASTVGGVLTFILEEVSSSHTFLISNTTFLENSSELGSVLYVNPYILLEQGLVTDSLVTGNSASEMGTLYVAAGSLSLVNTVFEGNLAKDGSGVYRDCSYYVNETCALSCQNVSLLRNTGAALIYFLPSIQPKSFTALQLLCTGNSGVCLSLDSTIAQCSYCEFSGNTARSGGGFLLSHSNLTIKHGKYRDNTVEGNGAVGVVDANSSLTCKYCEFANNTANRQGGALYITNSEVTIMDSNFSRNVAEEGGFALSFYRSLSVSISHTQFTDNSGKGIGVMTLLLANMNLTSCRITNNQYSQLTGGISLYLSELVIRDCEFRNQSSYSGSFLYISQSTVLIENSSFREGWAFSSGGAVAIVTSSVQLRNCAFSRLSAELGAAVFLQSATSLTFNQCQFQNITVGKSDRGVVNGYNSTISIISSHFANFTQSAVAGEDIELSLLDSLFQQATGNNGGAVSCIDCRLVHISACVFRNLSALNKGGALYLAVSSSADNWVIDKSTFEKCEAPEGGALIAENCSLTIVGNVFVDNKALGQGGAVLLAVRETDKFDVRENLFRANLAGLQGGSDKLERLPTRYIQQFLHC